MSTIRSRSTTPPPRTQPARGQKPTYIPPTPVRVNAPLVVSPYAMLPLRFFFGLTFVYAGLQKLTDSQFFSPSAPGYIGKQMAGFARGSPISVLMTSLAIPHAQFFGGMIAFSELLVGIAVTVGLLTRVAALGGMMINLTLWLTATWHVSPYFLGSDVVFCAGWLTLALTGAGPYSLDQSTFSVWWQQRMGSAEPRLHPAVARAAFMRGVTAVAGFVALGGVVGALAKMLTPDALFASNAAGSVVSTTTAPAGATGSTSAAPAASGPGTLLGSIKGMPVNQAATYTDPASGDPAVLVHLPSGKFVAYDAVCTHAGCTVQYDPTQKLLVCPCHGAAYDPTQAAAVVSGPAPTPLATLAVRVDTKGNVYALDASPTPTPAK